MSIVFGADPIGEELARVLDALASDRWDRTETAAVDLKEEAGRRDRAGRVMPGQLQNESAAQSLAGEAACMANTPGGGALILGAADDGELIGTALDVEWLRHRVYQLTENRLTIDARPVEVMGTRLLVISTSEPRCASQVRGDSSAGSTRPTSSRTPRNPGTRSCRSVCSRSELVVITAPSH